MLLGVDVGGTFTDAVLVGEGSTLHTAKVPSTPSGQAAGCSRRCASCSSARARTPRRCERFAHGMTVATNALLEGRTARTALIATEGFTDVIELGRQGRAHLYRLCRRRPRRWCRRELRFAAPERMGPDGPLRALEPAPARELVRELAGARARRRSRCACCTPTPTPRTSACSGSCLAELLPDAHVSLSSELVGTFREYERTATTVLDAALSPLLERLSATA